MKFLAKPTPHKEAVDMLRALPVVDRQTFDAMLPEFQHGAFLVTGINAHDALQDLRDLLETTQAGEDFEKVRQRVELAMEPFLGSKSRRRSLMLVRAWAFRASTVGVVRQLDNHRAVFPFRKRLSAGDGRVRDSHRAMHGMVLPADSPFWSRHTPPDAHNCRCYVTGVTRSQATRLAAQEESDVRAGTMLPEERRLATGAVAAQQEAGIINRGPALQWNLNKEAGRVQWDPRSLLMPLAQIEQRYTPDVWDAFKQWAQSVKPDGKVTLWEKLEAQRAGLPPVSTRAIQQALPLPGALPPPRTRDQVKAAIKALDIPSTTTPPVKPPRAPRIVPPVPAAPAPKPPAAPVKVTVSTPRPPRAPQPAPAKPAKASPVEQMRERIRTAAYKAQNKLGQQGINGSYLLTNGVKVVFKPLQDENPKTYRIGIPSGTQYRREVAASLVAEALQVDLVPPVAMLDYAGQTGSAMLYADGFRTAGDIIRRGVPGGLLSKIRRRDLEAWQLFDDIVNHWDRHPGNWMVKPRQDGSYEVALIDNGLSNCEFNANNGWGLGKRFAVGLEGRPLSTASQAGLTRFLAAEATLRTQLAGLLEPSAIDLLFQRARNVLQRGTYGDAV